MSGTPSKIRRKGREAFQPYEDPMDHQPYEKGWWAYKINLQDWLDGWEEAREAYEAQMKAEEQVQLMEEEEAEESYQRFLINKARYDEEHEL